MGPQARLAVGRVPEFPIFLALEGGRDTVRLLMQLVRDARPSFNFAVTNRDGVALMDVVASPGMRPSAKSSRRPPPEMVMCSKALRAEDDVRLFGFRHMVARYE
jgi:hypothetical protein